MYVIVGFADLTSRLCVMGVVLTFILYKLIYLYIFSN